MSTIYLRMPSRSAAENAGHWTGLPCPWAIAGNDGRIETAGQEPLSSLATELARAQRVVLILAASDVSLLQVQVPPLSATRLKAALPNLVEDQLISDPADCVLVASGTGAVRSVAVVQRAWLEMLLKMVGSMGARNVSAVPAQLCLPWEEGAASAGFAVHEGDIDLAVRVAPHDGVGVPILPDSPEAAPQEILDALQAVHRATPIRLYVPTVDLPAFQSALADHPLAGRVTLLEDDWRYLASGASAAGQINLVTGIGNASGPRFNWRAWRIPAALAAALLLVNLIGLHIDWWRMRSEANALRNTMNQIFRTAFPKEPVVLDPVAQMRQKVAAARRGAGEVAPDDFLALASAFAEAWGNAKGAREDIVAVEYRERGLLVRFKPNLTPPAEPVREALASRSLALAQAPAQNGAQVWQIRSAK